MSGDDAKTNVSLDRFSHVVSSFRFTSIVCVLCDLSVRKWNWNRNRNRKRDRKWIFSCENCINGNKNENDSFISKTFALNGRSKLFVFLVAIAKPIIPIDFTLFVFVRCSESKNKSEIDLCDLNWPNLSKKRKMRLQGNQKMNWLNWSCYLTLNFIKLCFFFLWTNLFIQKVILCKSNWRFSSLSRLFYSSLVFEIERQKCWVTMLILRLIAEFIMSSKLSIWMINSFTCNIFSKKAIKKYKRKSYDFVIWIESRTTSRIEGVIWFLNLNLSNKNKIEYFDWQMTRNERSIKRNSFRMRDFISIEFWTKKTTNERYERWFTIIYPLYLWSKSDNWKISEKRREKIILRFCCERKRISLAM